MRVCLTIPIATPHSISISRTQKRCSCVYLLLESSELICYIRDAWIYIPKREIEMERERERGKYVEDSEDNANTYFEPLFLMSTTYSVAICLQWYRCMIYLNIHFWHELVVEWLLCCLCCRCCFCFCFCFFRLWFVATRLYFRRMFNIYSDFDSRDEGVQIGRNQYTPSRYPFHHAIHTEIHELTMFNLVLTIDYSCMANIELVKYLAFVALREYIAFGLNLPRKQRASKKSLKFRRRNRPHC